MIPEVASFQIKPGEPVRFEETFDEAIKHLESSEGYHSQQLQRSIDKACHRLLLVDWGTVDDHQRTSSGGPC